MKDYEIVNAEAQFYGAAALMQQMQVQTAPDALTTAADPTPAAIPHFIQCLKSPLGPAKPLLPTDLALSQCLQQLLIPA